MDWQRADREVPENLYRRIAEQFGETVRDEVFSGIGIAPFGIPASEKPGYLQPVIERLEGAVGSQAYRELLADSLRDLPDEYYYGEGDTYRACKDIDEYLAKKKQAFVEHLEACHREGRLFFSQVVTGEVLEFVRREPEIGGGVRVGNVIYETKIPYMTQQYLDETDETLFLLPLPLGA